MDSASPVAKSVAGQTCVSDAPAFCSSMALPFFAFTHKPAEFGFHGANARFHGNACWNPIANAAAAAAVDAIAAPDALADPVPPRYRYRRSDSPRPTGHGRPA